MTKKEMDPIRPALDGGGRRDRSMEDSLQSGLQEGEELRIEVKVTHPPVM